MKLTPTVQRCILHWGEMASRWGVSRSVAQIHALLFLAPQPLTADEIAESLSVARSNVSVSLKELQSSTKSPAGTSRSAACRARRCSS
jgi:DNA-binding transcriptional regulator GbsR (MarR family)